MKKIISVFLALVIGVSFAACNKNGTDSVKEGDRKVWYFHDDETDAKKLFNDVTDTVNPTEIYANLDFSAEMLHGTYTINDLEKDVKWLEKSVSFRDAEFDNGTFHISALPVAVYFGAKYLPDAEANFKDVSDREVAALSFIVEDKIGTVPCTYEINGNEVKFTVLTETTENGVFSYELDKEVFEYQFSLCGPYLTLTNGNDTLKLTAFSFTDNNKSTATSLHGYSIEKTPLIDNLDYFVSQQDSFLNYAVARDGSYYRTSAFKLSDDGKCTVYLSYNDDAGNEHTFVQQYAYIVQCSGFPYLNSFSIVLLDGEKAYYYTDSVTDREARIMKSTGTDVDGMDEDTLQKIAEKSSDLFDDLYKEFEVNGISVQINRSTGEIAMDTTVLFGGDSAELTVAGKEFLNKFVKAYTAIIYNEKYDGFIAKTLVEGHIAPLATSTYESGLPLSEQRAKNVMEYCLSNNTGVDTTKLASTMETIGCSQSKPVYDRNGNVDLAASRRVSFKFVVNTDRI